jgi:hypothetical protein
MNKKIILLSIFAVLGIFFSSQTVYAASSILSVLPSTANENVGTAFNTSIQIDPQSNKICVIKGTLSFGNLSCKSITVANGLMVQAAPTCASPNFVIGIPKCTTVIQNIISASVVGAQAGQGTVSLANIKVIGSGVVVGSVFEGGTYNLTAAVIKPVTPKAITPTVNTTVTPSNAVVQPTQQLVEQPIQTPTEQPAQAPLVTGQQASLATTSPARTIIIIVIILLVIAIIGGAWYMLSKKKKK